MRLLLVETPPEDDPCQQMLVSGWACGVGHLGEDDIYGHPFTAPIAIDEAAIAAALRAWWDADWQTPGFRDPGDADWLAEGRSILAALTQPRRTEDGA